MKHTTRLLIFCLCLLGLPALAAPILQSGWTTTTSDATARAALKAVANSGGLATNLTHRGTETNFATTANGAGGIYHTYQTTWHSNSTYAAPWNFYQGWTYQTDFNHDHPDVVTTFGYNLNPAGIVNANEPALGYIFESRWQNFDNFEQSEWYLYYATPTNGYGTNYTIRFLSFTPQYKIGTDNQTFTSSDLSVESTTFNVKPPNWTGTAPFTVNNTPGEEAASLSLAGYLITRTNTENYGGMTLLGGEVDYTVPTGFAASHVANRIDYDNAVGFRPHFYSLFSGTAKSWIISGATNFSAGTFGLRTPPGTSIATPKVWADGIEATNSSSFTITAGGDTLEIGSDAVTASGSSGFVGVGTSLTALNASALGSGTVADARLSANVALLDRSPQLFTGPSNKFVNVGITAHAGINSASITNDLTVGGTITGGAFSFTSGNFGTLVATNFFVSSNLPPATPTDYGQKFFWNSNGQGTIFLLTANLNSLTWNRTQLLADHAALNAANLTSGVVPAARLADGSSLTNLTLTIQTNVINTGVIPVNRTTYTNLTANITIAGFSGVDLNGDNWANIYATNGSGPATPRSITFAASVFPSTNTFVLDRVVWVTNAVDITVKIRAWGTNMAAVRWTP